jgi:uncharacterized protein YajQ (UPF0234 family)
MPSLDVVSKIDFAELDNAINNTKKAIAARFDFRNSPVEITVDKKEKKLNIWAEDKTKQEAVKDLEAASCITTTKPTQLNTAEPRTVKAGKLTG